MSNSFTDKDDLKLQQWYQGLAMADRSNIFCYCHTCGWESVDSSVDAVCSKCNSTEVEHISCSQFPDD